MTLRRAALAALSAAVLVSVGPAAAAVALDGAYRTAVGGSGLLSGTWTIRFDHGARYTITLNGTRAVAGRFAVSGNRVTLSDRTGPLACTGAVRDGRYTFAKAGRRLTLTAVRDACAGRRAVLSGRALTRASA
jgi:hypothetical protein